MRIPHLGKPVFILRRGPHSLFFGPSAYIALLCLPNPSISSAHYLSGSRLNLKTVFPRLEDSHVWDKMVARPSYLQHGDPYTGKTTSLYLDGPQTSLFVSHYICKHHQYWSNQSKWTFSTQITEGARYVYPRVGEWVTLRDHTVSRIVRYHMFQKPHWDTLCHCWWMGEVWDGRDRTDECCDWNHTIQSHQLLSRHSTASFGDPLNLHWCCQLHRPGDTGSDVRRQMLDNGLGSNQHTT